VALQFVVYDFQQEVVSVIKFILTSYIHSMNFFTWLAQILSNCSKYGWLYT